MIFGVRFDDIELDFEVLIMHIEMLNFDKLILSMRNFFKGLFGFTVIFKLLFLLSLGIKHDEDFLLMCVFDGDWLLFLVKSNFVDERVKLNSFNFLFWFGGVRIRV